ncbi:hypothetical protein Golax_024254 [Gossypium laxum]|uniref:DUF4283 domain-containing protein n=1 Tax=Gossypium laxum TaxID=34288 RepID=A0A7J8ZBR3_9ROSI|nr:hypothetical protein [Gossypium laxum]
MENKLVDLHIKEEEEEVLRVEETVGDHKPVYDLCLVGCFVTASVVHFPAMCNTLVNLWHPLGGIEILDLRKKILIDRLDSSLAIGRDLMIHDLEKSLIGDFEGKKSQRVGGCSEGVYESLNFTGKCDE